MPCRLLIILTVFVSAGCSSAPVIGPHESDLQHNRLYVVNHGWHTGIIVDAGLLEKYIQPIPSVTENSRFVEFGWGDEMFYRAPAISVWLAIRALFWPTDSVMHISGIHYDPLLYYRHSELESIIVTKAQFDNILRFIAESFERDSHGNMIRLDDGDRFYRARGQYHLFYTCNSWVMDALSSAGITDQLLPTLTADGAMCAIRRSLQADHQVPSRQEVK